MVRHPRLPVLLCLALALLVFLASAGSVEGFEPAVKRTVKKARITPASSSAAAATGAQAAAQPETVNSAASEDATAASRTDNFVLQHSLDGGRTFVDRSILALKFGAAAGSKQGASRGAVGSSNSVGQASFEEQTALSLEQKRQLVALAVDGGFYTVRLVDQTGEVVTQAFVSACHLVQSRLREQFTFHVDPLGNVVGLGYATPSASASLACDAEEAAAVLQDDAAALKEGFRPKGRFGLGAAGQAPKQVRAAGPTAINGQPVKRGEESQAEPGFLQKYWMYILIGVVVLVIQTVMAPPPADGQQAPAQSSAAAPPSK